MPISKRCPVCKEADLEHHQLMMETHKIHKISDTNYIDLGKMVESCVYDDASLVCPQCCATFASVSDLKEAQK